MKKDLTSIDFSTITTKEVGALGEELAALWLLDNGFNILQRNWHNQRREELDIVAFKECKLHFVEVKTRTTSDMDHTLMAVNREKLDNIMSAAGSFMRYFRLDYPLCYAAIGVTLDVVGKDYEVRYVSDIQEIKLLDDFDRRERAYRRHRMW